MKHFVSILLFFVLAIYTANAQDPSPAYPQQPTPQQGFYQQGNPQGVVQYGQPSQYSPQQQYAPAQFPAQYPNQNPAQYPAQQPNYAPAPYPAAQPQYPAQYYQQPFFDDSVAYYQNLIESYTQSGNSKRTAGKAMMLGGGIAAAVSGVMMIWGLVAMDCNEDRCNDDAAISYIAGYLIFLGGATVFTTGLVVKIVGGSKLRKADRYRNTLMQYTYRRQHAMQLEIEPIINARKGAYGSRLSLNF